MHCPALDAVDADGYCSGAVDVFTPLTLQGISPHARQISLTSEILKIKTLVISEQAVHRFNPVFH
jgi:hypothetical protein